MIMLKSLAEELNLSLSTASKVLKGMGYVSDETRKRILETAKKIKEWRT